MGTLRVRHLKYGPRTALLNPCVGCATHSTSKYLMSWRQLDDLQWPADGHYQCSTFSKKVWNQFIALGGMEILVDLSEIPESRTLSRIHATADAAFDCVSMRLRKS